MSYKITVVYAWSIFVGILAVELGIDYFVRLISEDFYDSGIYEPIWFLIHIIAAGIAGYFLFCGFRCLEKTYQKIIHVVLNLVLGFFVYIVITGLYILGLGIDSL